MVAVDVEQPMAAPLTPNMNSAIGIGQFVGMWSIFIGQVQFAENRQVSGYKPLSVIQTSVQLLLL